MFENIPSLKDFIIYLIPGILICYFTLGIMNCSGYVDLINIKYISESSGLTFIGILFSFLIGFIASQSQIILFNYLLKIFKEMETLLSVNISHGEKKNIVKYFNRLNGNINKYHNVCRDRTCLHVCLTYVMIRTNKESMVTINRQKNLSVLALSLPIPMILGVCDFLLNIGVTSNYLFVCVLIYNSWFLYIIFKIHINFKRGWVKDIYEQFLVISLLDEKDKLKAIEFSNG
jgi:hypothetical protein